MSERPTVRRTWAVKGRTPVVKSSGSWKNLSLMGTLVCTAGGRKPKLFLKSRPGAVNADVVLVYLKELRRHLRGRKLLLFWDGLPAHRAKIVQKFLEAHQARIRAVRFPAYAPELNPPEYLWSALKSKDLANLEPELRVVSRAVGKGYRRIRRRPDLLKGFLKASKLFN